MEQLSTRCFGCALDHIRSIRCSSLLKIGTVTKKLINDKIKSFESSFVYNARHICTPTYSNSR